MEMRSRLPIRTLSQSCSELRDPRMSKSNFVVRVCTFPGSPLLQANPMPQL